MGAVSCNRGASPIGGLGCYCQVVFWRNFSTGDKVGVMPKVRRPTEAAFQVGMARSRRFLCRYLSALLDQGSTADHVGLIVRNLACHRSRSFSPLGRYRRYRLRVAIAKPLAFHRCPTRLLCQGAPLPFYAPPESHLSGPGHPRKGSNLTAVPKSTSSSLRAVTKPNPALRHNCPGQRGRTFQRCALPNCCCRLWHTPTGLPVVLADRTSQSPPSQRSAPRRPISRS